MSPSSAMIRCPPSSLVDGGQCRAAPQRGLLEVHAVGQVTALDGVDDRAALDGDLVGRLLCEAVRA